MELSKHILEYIQVLIWPITIFIISILFRRQIIGLFERITKVELPGGISIETELMEGRKLADLVENNRDEKVKSLIVEKRNISDSEANKRMLDLGLTPSPSGLDIRYYENIALNDTRLAIAGLRIDFELMIKNLAKGFNVSFSNRDSNTIILKRLLSDSKITYRQYELLLIVLNVATKAIHGEDISMEQVQEILNISKVLIDDYIAWLYWNFPDK